MSNRGKNSRPILTVTWLLLLLLPESLLATDAWVLDAANSSISFTSVKNGNLAEGNWFTALSGGITKSGRARLQVDLHSVNTLIPIRDERMVRMLFNKGRYAVFQAELGAGFEALPVVGGDRPQPMPVAGKLSLNGQVHRLSAELGARLVAPGRVLVFTNRTIIIPADQFGLLAGIEALRAVAGLQSIAHQVPIQFVLLFDSAPSTPSHGR